MKVLLVDVDGKIPNLALMKISTYYKAKGYEVGLNISDPDIVCASIVYRKNTWKARAIPKMYPTAQVFVGGTFLPTSLPLAVESLKPDYALYPSSYSMGFTTRGCIRHCSFCVVPYKEGSLVRWKHPKEFHDFKFDTIMLLDNNWLALPYWFLETSEWILEHQLNVVEHGLDIRLVGKYNVKRLLDLKIKQYHFAYDFDELEPIIRKKLKLLKSAGFDVRNKVQFYVYVDSDSSFRSGLRRARQLKKWGTNAFIMFNIDKKKTQRIIDLQRWVNRKEFYWSMDFLDFDRVKSH